MPRLQAGLDKRLLGPRIIVVPLSIITHTNGFKLREIANVTHEVSSSPSLGGRQHDLPPSRQRSVDIDRLRWTTLKPGLASV
jgi:hypothetical protein